MAGFDTKSEAVQVRRSLLSRARLFSSVVYCEQCDTYHVPIESLDEEHIKTGRPREPWTPRNLKKLSQAIQGGGYDEAVAQFPGYTHHYLRTVASRYDLRFGSNKVEPEMRRPDLSTVRVIELLAQGYRDQEIANIIAREANLGVVTARSVTAAISKAMERLYAMSRPNLIAICSAHGIINPRQFVPEVKRKEHD